jgi:hypothetical protein
VLLFCAEFLRPNESLKARAFTGAYSVDGLVQLFYTDSGALRILAGVQARWNLRSGMAQSGPGRVRRRA